MINQTNWEHLASTSTTTSVTGITLPKGSNFNAKFSFYEKLKVVWSLQFQAVNDVPFLYDGLGLFASSYRTRWWTYNVGSTTPTQRLTSAASGLALSGAGTGSSPGRLFGVAYINNIPNPLTNERTFLMHTTYFSNGALPTVCIGTGSTTYITNPIGRLDVGSESSSTILPLAEISVFGCNYRD